jgi:hypothetical protein
MQKISYHKAPIASGEVRASPAIANNAASFSNSIVTKRQGFEKTPIQKSSQNNH